MSEPVESNEETAERFWARTSVRLGMASMGLCMAGPLTCFFSFWIALPISIAALWAGREGWLGSTPGTASRAYAKAGLTSGLIGFIGSALYFLLMQMYAAMWGALFILDEI